MRHRSLFADSLASGTALRRLGAVLLLMLVCGGLVGLDVASAEGREIAPVEYPQYRQALLKAEEPGDVTAVLRRLVATSRAVHPEVYGKIVGPILQDTSLTSAVPVERRRMLFSTLITHLIAEQPNSDAILLINDILQRLSEDPALIERILTVDHKPDPVTGRRLGWERLLKRARELVRSDDQELRSAAIRVAAHVRDEDVARVVAALHDSLRSGERKPTADDVEAYLDAAELLLHYRFADLGALVTFLNPIAAKHFGTPESREAWTAGDKQKIRAELYRAVIQRQRDEGGEQATRERQAAMDYGRAVIEKAKGPADLRVFFDPERQRIAALQQAALQKADTLEPKPTQAWADLLIAALDHSDHMAVLEATVALLTKTFTEPSEPGQLLAAAIARRLAQGGGSDRIDLREKLATVLGRIGTAKDVRDALAGRARVSDDPQKAVWSRLIRALGTVSDGQVLWLRPHYQPTAAREEWERLAVAETLGQQGFRSRPGKRNPESHRAALFLMHILHGWPGAVVNVQREFKEGEETKTVTVSQLFVDDGDKNELETEAAKAALAAGERRFEFEAGSPDPSEAVREEAAKSLLFHDTPQTAAALARAAEEDSDVGAAALRTLGLQLRRGSDHAASALARLIEQGPTEARLLATLDVITRTPAPTGRLARAQLGSAVVDLLKKGGSEAVLRAAAATGAHLGQLGALKPVYIFWRGIDPEQEAERRKAWGDLLRGVIAGIAKAGANEGKLDLDFKQVASELLLGNEEHIGVFTETLAGLGDAAGRFELKRFRAELLMQHVGITAGHTIEQRRAELDTVIALYGELAEEAAVKNLMTLKKEMQRLRYDALHLRWAPPYLKTGEDAEDPAEFQLAALQAAVESADPDTANSARQAEVSALQKNDKLSKEQSDRLAKLVKALAEITASAAPPEKKAK